MTPAPAAATSLLLAVAVIAVAMVLPGEASLAKEAPVDPEVISGRALEAAPVSRLESAVFALG